MKRTLSGAALLLLAAIAVPGCNKDKSTPEPGPAAATSVEPVTAAVLPPRADEEQKASQEITSENYKSQLDQLEKEIDQP
jgi:hypothetical protein